MSHSNHHSRGGARACVCVCVCARARVCVCCSAFADEPFHGYFVRPDGTPKLVFQYRVPSSLNATKQVYIKPCGESAKPFRSLSGGGSTEWYAQKLDAETALLKRRGNTAKDLRARQGVLQVHAFRCPFKLACPAQRITTHIKVHASTLSTPLFIPPQQCAACHYGILCRGCTDGAGHNKEDVCEICDLTSGNNVRHITFMLCALFVVIVILHKIMAWRRSLLAKKTSRFPPLFRFIDIDKSGSVSKGEIATRLEQLGANLDNDQLTAVMDAIDVDHSGR